MIESYLNEMKDCIDIIKSCGEEIDRIIKILDRTKDKHQVFICGNGGSAANASHFALHLQMLCRASVHCLTDNNNLLTALANDEGYEKIFVEQLKVLARPKDILIVISGSGKSPNIINAINWALKNDMKVIGFVGLTGGFIKDMKGVECIHIPTDMQHSEDSHMVAIHCITACLIEENKKRWYCYEEI